MTKKEFIHAVENVFQKGKYSGSDKFYNIWKHISSQDIGCYYSEDFTHDDIEYVADILMDEFNYWGD